jgi:geranylgeranyl transferase type-2 subunit beta
VLSALSILGRISWIDRKALGRFIVGCQDQDRGGISDRPDNMADVFHTFFGVAGLSLLGYSPLGAIDPVYALPVAVIEGLGLPKRYHVE